MELSGTTAILGDAVEDEESPPDDASSKPPKSGRFQHNLFPPASTTTTVATSSGCSHRFANAVTIAATAGTIDGGHLRLGREFFRGY